MLSILSKTHVEGSRVFVYYNIFLALIIIIIALINIVKGKGVFEKRKIFIVFSLIMFLVYFLLNFTISGQPQILSQLLTYFIGFTIPAVVLGLNIKNADLAKLFQKMKYINIFLIISFIIASFNNYDPIYNFNTISGASHLLIGYTLSALFPFNFIKFVTSKSKLNKFIYLTTSAICVFLIMFSGSKGGFVSVVLSSIFLLKKYVLKGRKIVNFMFFLIFSTILILLIDFDFSDTFWRISTLFSGDFNTASSGRGIYFDTAFEVVRKYPLFGAGLTYYSEFFGEYTYPHNIFLEVLTIFGYVGLLIFLLLLVKPFKTLKFFLKQENFSYVFFALLFINTMVELVFSGSFLYNHQFWLCIITLYTFSKKNDPNREVAEIK